MAEIKSKKFLQYARESFDLAKGGNEERELINTFGFIMKGFHSQIDELVEYISEFKKPKKGLIYFPDKIEFVKNSDITLPKGILRLNKLRNDSEHRHTIPPPRDVVSLALTFLDYFIRDAKKFMKVPAKEVKKLIDEKLRVLETKRKNISPSVSSVESYILQSKKFLYLYGKKPNSLNGEDANNYMKRIINEKYPPRHIQQVEAIIQFLYKYVLKEKWIKDYKRPPINREEPTQLYYAQIQKISKLAPSIRDQLIIKFIYHTGLKAGQVVKTKIGDIPKFNLPESELENLRKYLGKRDKGPIFLSQYNVGLGQRGIERIFEIITKRYGRRVYSEMIRKSNPKIRYQRGKINTKSKRRPRFALTKDQVITKKEFQLLLKNAGTKLKRYYIYFTYHFQVGLSQFAGIKFEDIDFQKGIIRVEPSKKHFKKKQTPPLEKEVLDTLKAYCVENNIKKGKLFFYVVDSIRNIIQDAGRAAGLEEKKLGYGVLANSIEFSKIYGIK